MYAKRLYMYLFLIAAFVCPPCYGDWKSDANTRIEQIRKRNAEITVVDSVGNPIPDVNVQIEQIGHRFAFGSCINTNYTIANYANFFKNHFEWAVCENDTKWLYNESSQGSVNYTNANNIYQWSNSNGIKMRGHCLFWEQPGQVQTWVQNLTYATYPTSSALLSAVDSRINSAIPHFSGKFHNWDVDNEMLSPPLFYDRLGNGGRVHMFNAAKALDPNCGVFMNEYNGNSFGGYSSTNYVSLATTLIGLGATINGFGIQAHLDANVPFSPTSYYTNVLQPLAALNRPIWATEFDAPYTNVTTSADNIENFFRICFSHPSVEGIIMWGFWQGSMWRSNAYLVDNSWNLTERGTRYESLMDEWTTEDANTTDSNGEVSFRGFHGTYKITLSKTGRPTEIYTIELEPGETTAQFVLERYISDVGVLGSWVSGTTHAKEPGADRALVFIAHAEHTAATSLTSVTYGGQAMTKVVDKIISSGSTRTYVAAFILNDAGITAATTTTFSPVWSVTPTSSAYGSVFLQNVNQSALTGATASDEIATGYMLTTPRLATSAGDMVIDAATCSNAGSYTVNNAFTKALELTITSADAVEGYKTANGASEIPSVTHSINNSRQSAIGFVVQAVDEWLYGDLTHDNRVDMDDLPEFCEVWLVPDCNNIELDLNDDCIINFYEYSFFAQNWLREL
jgi:GH35 family endo-1,4-beta-xylanase